MRHFCGMAKPPPWCACLEGACLVLAVVVAMPGRGESEENCR